MADIARPMPSIDEGFERMLGQANRLGLLLLCLAMAAPALPGATAKASPAIPSFYDIDPALLPGKPGSVIKIETAVALPPGAVRAYRMLYRSTGLRNEPIAVSGVIAIPPGPPPPAGRLVLSWAHPTTGVARQCAPSRDAGAFSRIPAIGDFLRKGFVVVATDYPGLGAGSTHPYLVGLSEAHAVLDAARAARAVPQSGAGRSVAVWGFSQGGHAAIWAANLAKTYAPDLNIIAVAAAAPPTDLSRLIAADLPQQAGKVLSSFAIWSWSRLYDVSLDAVIEDKMRLVLARIVGTCSVSEGDILDLGFSEMAFEREGFLKVDITRNEPWIDMIRQNSPAPTPAGIPVLIAQGAADTIVPLAVSGRYVATLCARNLPVRFLQVAGVGHGETMATTSGATYQWLVDRYYQNPMISDCGR